MNIESSTYLMFGVSTLCGFIITIFYIAHAGITAYSKSLAFTMIIVVVLMAGILNSVGTNIAASISLFGALSLLRFRSIVNSTDDMGFLLAAVTIGLASGTKNYQLIFPIVFIVGFIVTVFKFIRLKGSSESQTFVVSYIGDIRQSPVLDVLNSYKLKNIHIISKSVKASTNERVLSICCSGRPCDSLAIIESLLSIDGVLKAKVISNERN